MQGDKDTERVKEEGKGWSYGRLFFPPLEWQACKWLEIYGGIRSTGCFWNMWHHVCTRYTHANCEKLCVSVCRWSFLVRITASFILERYRQCRTNDDKVPRASSCSELYLLLFRQQPGTDVPSVAHVEHSMSCICLWVVARAQKWQMLPIDPRLSSCLFYGYATSEMP